MGLRRQIAILGPSGTCETEFLWHMTLQGPELSCIVCRTCMDGPAAKSLAILIVTREDIAKNRKGALRMLEDITRKSVAYLFYTRMTDRRFYSCRT